MKCRECGATINVSDDDWDKKINTCPNCGWQGNKHKTYKMGKVRKPWSDNSIGLVGPHRR